VPSLLTQVEPSDLAYTLSIDGIALPSQVHGLPYRLNPGSHSVRVEGAGYEPSVQQVTLRDEEHQTLTVRLTAKPTVAVAPVDAAYHAPMASRTEPLDNHSSGDGGGRVRAIIGFGVGGSALVAGSITGILSLSQASDIKRECDGNTCSSSQREALSSATTLANVANICLPIGVIGIAYGLYELLSLPSGRSKPEHASGVQLDFTGTSATLRGSL
jgi:hypothetical protein